MTTTRRFGTSLVCAATALVPGSVATWALEFDDGVQRYSFDIRTSGNGSQDVDVAVDAGVATKR